MEKTTIRITKELADELHDRKRRGESYEDVLRRELPGINGEQPAN